MPAGKNPLRYLSSEEANVFSVCFLLNFESSAIIPHLITKLILELKLRLGGDRFQTSLLAIPLFLFIGEVISGLFFFIFLPLNYVLAEKKMY